MCVCMCVCMTLQKNSNNSIVTLFKDHPKTLSLTEHVHTFLEVALWYPMAVSEDGEGGGGGGGSSTGALLLPLLVSLALRMSSVG